MPTHVIWCLFFQQQKVNFCSDTNKYEINFGQHNGYKLSFRVIPKIRAFHSLQDHCLLPVHYHSTRAVSLCAVPVLVQCVIVLRCKWFIWCCHEYQVFTCLSQLNWEQWCQLWCFWLAIWCLTAGVFDKNLMQFAFRNKFDVFDLVKIRYGLCKYWWTASEMSWSLKKVFTQYFWEGRICCYGMLRENKKIAILALTPSLNLTQTLTLGQTLILILTKTQNLTQTLW